MSTVSGLDIANNVEREWRDRMNSALKAEREKVAQWMISRGYATGHGDTIEDLLQELEWQIAENWTRALVNGVEGEREACAKECENQKIGFPSYFEIDERIQECADAIRKRSNT